MAPHPSKNKQINQNKTHTQKNRTKNQEVKSLINKFSIYFKVQSIVVVISSINILCIYFI